MLQIVAVLLALIILLLTIPVKVSFKIGRIKEIKGQVILYGLFGLVRFRVSVPGGAQIARQHKRKPKETAEKRKKRGKVRDVLALLKQSPFRRRAIRFISSLLRATHTRAFYLRLRIGLGDPADTGRLWGFLGPIAGIAANFRHAKVRIEPEFMFSVFELESHGELRFIPLQFIGLAAAFAASPETRYAWRTLRWRKI